jgi:hypothetical protein
MFASSTPRFLSQARSGGNKDKTLLISITDKEKNPQ